MLSKEQVVSRHVCNDNSITNCAAVDDNRYDTTLSSVATLFPLHQEARLMMMMGIQKAALVVAMAMGDV